ncbi:MAG: YhcH/YjgK/YiaL family protein [Clostridiales bacterium]|nr:YhcH/YjgK/YiaL family protein [Clostridiales bacterium]
MKSELSYETLIRLHKALDIVESGKLDNLDVGHYDLFDGVYVNVMEYETKEEGVFESHHEYIDVHYPIEGSERIELLEEDKLEVTGQYDKTKDCVFGKGKGESFVIREKQAFVVMPGEAHIPRLKVKEIDKVKKAVVKLKIL